MEDRSEGFSLCVFCRRGDLSRDVVGETYRKAGVTVHEYCLVSEPPSVASLHA